MSPANPILGWLSAGGLVRDGGKRETSLELWLLRFAGMTFQPSLAAVLEALFNMEDLEREERRYHGDVR